MEKKRKKRYNRIDTAKDVICGCGALATILAVIAIDNTWNKIKHIYFHISRKEHYRRIHPYYGFKTYDRGPKELSDVFSTR